MADLCQGRIADGRDALDITEEVEERYDDTFASILTTQVNDDEDDYDFSKVFDPVSSRFTFFVTQWCL